MVSGRYFRVLYRWGMLPSLSFLVASIGILGVSRSASADPHAMFFTTVGQQQLFFNLLAALDQADYVETPQARRFLLDNRERAGFGPEGDPRVRETETKLANLLTRSVTLEGQDLWTAYLTHQFAIEAARRNGIDEVARVYCERGLGRPGCTNKITGESVTQAQNKAFITDPLARDQEVTKAGDSVLYSGTSEDQAIRKKINTPNDVTVPKRPRPKDGSVQRFNQETSSNIVLDRAASRVREEVAGIENNALINPYADLVTNVDGEGKSHVSSKVANGDVIASSLEAMIGVPHALLAAASSGEQELRTFQAAEQGPGGSLADSTISAKEAPDGQVGDITGRITTSAGAKDAQIVALADSIGDVNTDLKFAPPEAESQPGTVPTVDRGQQVAGTQTTAAASGEVAGIGDIFNIVSVTAKLFEYYDSQKRPLSPDDNPVTPTKEKGVLNAMQALTNDTYRQFDTDVQTCGFCVEANSIINNVWALIRDFLCIQFGIACRV